MKIIPLKLCYVFTIVVLVVVGINVFLVKKSKLNKYNLGDIKIKEPKIVCIIDTHPGRFKQADIDIIITWAKRCDWTYFITSVPEKPENKPDKSMKIIKYTGHDSEHFGKLIQSLEYVYEKHKNELDWIVKTSDEVFVVPENLRHFILHNKLSSSDPVWFGAEHLTKSKSSVYMARDGYVLSKGTLEKFMDHKKVLAKGDCDFKNKGANEEQEFSKCLNALNVKSVDTRDHLGRHRFLTMDIGSMLVPIYHSKNKREGIMKYPYQQGPNCCAEDPIVLKGGSMRFFDFMLYEMRHAGEM